MIPFQCITAHSAYRIICLGLGMPPLDLTAYTSMLPLTVQCVRHGHGCTCVSTDPVYRYWLERVQLLYPFERKLIYTHSFLNHHGALTPPHPSRIGYENSCTCMILFRGTARIHRRAYGSGVPVLAGEGAACVCEHGTGGPADADRKEHL